MPKFTPYPENEIKDPLSTFNYEPGGQAQPKPYNPRDYTTVSVGAPPRPPNQPNSQVKAISTTRGVGGNPNAPQQSLDPGAEALTYSTDNPEQAVYATLREMGVDVANSQNPMLNNILQSSVALRDAYLINQAIMGQEHSPGAYRAFLRQALANGEVPRSTLTRAAQQAPDVAMKVREYNAQQGTPQPLNQAGYAAILYNLGQRFQNPGSYTSMMQGFMAPSMQNQTMQQTYNRRLAGSAMEANRRYQMQDPRTSPNDFYTYLYNAGPAPYYSPRG